VDESKLKDLFDWAFGRNGSLHQVIYLDAVAEVERLARLGAAVEAIVSIMKVVCKGEITK